MSETTLYLVIKATGTDSDGVTSTTKTITIPNPVAKAEFDADDVDTFIMNYNSVYQTNLTTQLVYYETRSREYVYPKA